MAAALPDGRPPESRATELNDADALRARVAELETLCAEVYVAGVDLGLPHALLNRLWTVAAHGTTPHAYHLEMPPRPPAPAPVPQPIVATPATATPIDATTSRREPIAIPDIRLTDRPKRPEARAYPPQAELKGVPERRTVLVVDDDAMMLEVLVRILQRENYTLLTATSGPDALQVADGHEGTIDLLITDYAMPEMKGRELAEKMRARYRDIKVLYQTGFSDMLFEDRAELEEGSAFLEKPFTARGLQEAARFILFGTINPQ